MAARPPAPPPGSTTCPSCGWANAPGASACGFCKMPFARAPKEPGPLPPRTMSSGLPAPPPPAEESALAESWDNLKERLRPSPQVLIIGLLVSGALMGFCVQYRYNMKATTADHIRQIKKSLEIYEGETGGYPASLRTLQQRGALPPSFVLKDAWDRDIVYTVSNPRERSETGEMLFLKCELRSWGSNGKPGDDDDVVWTGSAE